MPIVYHRDREATSPYGGITRMITADRDVGAGALTMGIVTIEPGSAVLPHTHLVEEAMTILEGDVRVLVGDQVTEIRGGAATIIAPGNTVHALRNIGSITVRMVIA